MGVEAAQVCVPSTPSKRGTATGGGSPHPDPENVPEACAMRSFLPQEIPVYPARLEENLITL